jgi:hypothetical protein
VYSSSSIIGMMKSRRMRWARNVTSIGTRGLQNGFLWESQKDREHQKDLDVCGRIIL